MRQNMERSVGPGGVVKRLRTLVLATACSKLQVELHVQGQLNGVLAQGIELAPTHKYERTRMYTPNAKTEFDDRKETRTGRMLKNNMPQQI